MSKRSSKPAQTNDFQRQEVLQAVVLADSFFTRFAPITSERPKVLLPLVNIPMIDYTLEFLAAGGVEEIFVLCCAHAQQVKSYLQKSPWTKRAQPKIQIIVSEQSVSAGEALRHLDTMDLIKDDFVLISGDVISNIKLDAVVKIHKARVKQDKRNIVTMIMKQASQNHRTRSLEDDTVVAINRDTDQLIMYVNDPKNSAVHLDAAILALHNKCAFRYDLMDCHIDICSPDVLPLFTDNFDYQDLRSDFVCGVLEQEILGNKIFTHVISGEYAARIKDLRTYDSVSKDIIHRWVFPMVPEINLLGPTSYSFSRHNIYRERHVTLARSCKIMDDTVVGDGTSIGANCVVIHSVLGRNCRLGNNVQVSGSYLWGDCVIEDGVTLDQAIVCQGVTIRQGAKIEKGAILSFGVVIGAGFVVKAYTTITTFQDPEEETKVSLNDPNVVGAGGSGRAFVAEADEDEEENGLGGNWNSIAPGPKPAPLQDEDSDPYTSEEEGDEEEEHPTEPANVTHHDDKIETFYSEVRETLRRGFDENLPVDAIVLEMASLKLSHDATLVDYTAAALQAMLGSVGVPLPEDCKTAFRPTKAVMEKILKRLKAWNLVFTKYGRVTRDQVFIITGLQNVCSSHNLAWLALFQPILNDLYNQDVVSEEAVLNWEETASDEPLDSDASKILSSASTFLTWLKETDDEGDEGDEGDEDEK